MRGAAALNLRNCRLSRRDLVIEPRIYRAAFVPALLAIVLTMFSFESRPGPLRQGLPADVLFDGNQAAGLAARIAAQQPDRRAGSAGDRATAQLVADTFAARGFAGGGGTRPVVQRFTSDGQAARERGRPASGQLAPADRDRRGARRGARCPTRPAARRTPRRSCSSRGCTRGARPRRRSCWRRSTARTSGEAGARRLDRRAARAGPRGRGGGRLGPGRAAAARPARAGVVERLHARAGIALQRTVAESIRLELGSRGRRQRHVRAARAAVVPDRDRRPGRAARLRLRRGADLGQRRAAAGRQRPGRTRSTPTAWAGSAARRCRTLTAARPGPAAGARAEELPAGGEPGAARVGAVAARGRAPAAGARGVGRRVRPRPQAARWTC